MTLPTEFDGLRLPAQARQLMTLVLQSGRPALTTTEGYVALRGAADHSIAAFEHADRVSIALDREDADRLGRIEGFRSSGPTTRRGTPYCRGSYSPRRTSRKRHGRAIGRSSGRSRAGSELRAARGLQPSRRRFRRPARCTTSR